jgi:hypothetical protein
MTKRTHLHDQLVVFMECPRTEHVHAGGLMTYGPLGHESDAGAGGRGPTSTPRGRARRRTGVRFMCLIRASWRQGPSSGRGRDRGSPRSVAHPAGEINGDMRAWRGD